MSFYRAYLTRLVGGFKNTNVARIKPGQVITFKYNPSDEDKKTRRKLFRIVFVLNTYRDQKSLKLHGLNLEILPWTEFKTFLNNILVTDTISLLKRRYEIKSPVKEIINRPQPFYSSTIKRILQKRECYRTYITTNMTQIKLGYLDFSKLFSGKKDMQQTLISKQDNINELQREKKIVEDALGFKLDRISDKKFKSVVLERFGDVDTFISVFREVEDFVKDVEATSSEAPPIEEK